MFDLFRRRDTAMRYLLTGVLGVIALSMVVTLIPGWGSNTGGGDRNDVVAEIGGEKITVRDAVTNVQGVVRRMGVPPAAIRTMANNFVDSMISSQAMALQAKELGLTPTDSDVATAIKSRYPQLFPNGQFIGQDVYANFLAQQGTTVKEFEMNIRRQIMVERLTKLMEDSVIVTEKEILEEFQANNLKIKVDYIAVPSDAFSKAVTVSDADVEKIYNAGKSAYVTQPRYNFALVVLDEARTAMSMTVPESDLRAAYNADQERFRMPERAKVRHILVGKDKPAEAAKYEALARDILNQLKGGANFADLAKKYSEDPSNKDSGGELGYIQRGQMVPEFERASFTQKVNEFGGPVKTMFGYHIVQVTDKQEARLQSFEEVKEMLKAEVSRNSINSKMLADADKLRAQLVKNSKDLDGPAKAANANVYNYQDRELGGPVDELGAFPAVAETVRSLKPGEVSAVTAGPGNKAFLVIHRGTIAPRQMTLAEAAPQIRQAEVMTRSQNIQAEKIREIDGKAKQPGADFAALAKQYNLTSKTTDAFGMTGFAEGLGAASAIPDAFKLPVGGVLGPVMFDGKQHFVRVKERIEADPSKMAAERASLLDKVKVRRSRERMDIFEDSIVNNLIAQGKLKIYEDAKQKVLASF